MGLRETMRPRARVGNENGEVGGTFLLGCSAGSVLFCFALQVSFLS